MNEHWIRVKISDDKNQTAEKLMGLNITMGEEPKEIVKVDKVIPTVLKDVPLGEIDYISVFGEVNMTLNSSKHASRDLDLKNITNDTMDVYIEP